MVPSTESIIWDTELINNTSPSTYNLTLNKGRDRFISVNAMSLDNGGGWEKNASFSLSCGKKNVLHMYMYIVYCKIVTCSILHIYSTSTSTVYNMYMYMNNGVCV